ncbi:MAG: ATP-binding protein [Bacteroidia bacterium]
MELSELRKIVRKGEGEDLEFKRKATHPHRIAREVIAFANTNGGKLLVGVDDDKTIYGCKYAGEEAFAITSFLEAHCRPRIPFQHQLHISINSKGRFWFFSIPESRRKPHFLNYENQRQTFVRVEDMSITASQEMITVLKNSHKKTGVSIRFGDREKNAVSITWKNLKILRLLKQKLLKITRRNASGYWLLWSGQDC